MLKFDGNRVTGSQWNMLLAKPLLEEKGGTVIQGTTVLPIEWETTSPLKLHEQTKIHLHIARFNKQLGRSTFWSRPSSAHFHRALHRRFSGCKWCTCSVAKWFTCDYCRFACCEVAVRSDPVSTAFFCPVHSEDKGSCVQEIQEGCTKPSDQTSQEKKVQSLVCSTEGQVVMSVPVTGVLHAAEPAVGLEKVMATSETCSWK